MEVVPLDPRLSFGAEVRGVDLARPLTDEEAAAIRTAWLEHHLLVFRGQALQPADEVRLAKLFPHDETKEGAELWGGGYKQLRAKGPQRTARLYVPAAPEVELRGVATLHDHFGCDGELKESNPPAEWHTDGTDRPEDSGPPIYTQMYSAIAPAEGGDTMFASALLAWQLLPPALQARASKLRARLTTEPFEMEPQWGGRRGRPTFNPVQPPDYDVTHPLCRLHPRTGEPALCVAPLFLHSMEGVDEAGNPVVLPPDEAHELCAELLAPGVSEEHVLSWKWSEGDLVCWDNLAMLHSPTASDDLRGERLCHRVRMNTGAHYRSTAAATPEEGARLRPPSALPEGVEPWPWALGAVGSQADARL